MGDDTYGSATATGMSLETLKSLFDRHGCGQIFVKALAPNDNSKNQIYLASHPDRLRGIPTEDWEIHKLTSRKPNTANKKILRAKVSFNWLLPDGNSVPAKSANLIFTHSTQRFVFRASCKVPPSMHRTGCSPKSRVDVKDDI